MVGSHMLFYGKHGVVIRKRSYIPQLFELRMEFKTQVMFVDLVSVGPERSSIEQPEFHVDH